MKLDVYNDSGKKVGDITVSKEVFDLPFNEGLVHTALVRQQANSRRAIAKTKTRGEVSGGGKKPWKQKGTGRARTGSIRNPIWRGGGITFGPTGKENYSKDLPKKQRRIAINTTLSQKTRDKQVLVLESYTKKDIKTKDFADMIKSLPVERSVLIVIPERNEIIEKSAKNLPNVRVILSQYINIADLLKYRYILLLKDCIASLEPYNKK